MADTVKSNINTLLMVATLGLLGWVATTAQSTSVQVARLSTSVEQIVSTQNTSDRDVRDLREKIARIELTMARLQIAEGK